MENKDKLRVLLKHWIEHNSGHVEEFTKWQKIITEEQDAATVADALEQAMEQMDRVSDILQAALDDLGGPLDSADHHHHHHHHH